MNDGSLHGHERKTRLFKYYPGDFGDLLIKVIHMDLSFDIFDDHTRVESRLHAMTLEKTVGAIDLNARDLEIVSVRAEGREIDYTYDREAALLRITFSRPVPQNTRITLVTETVCRPTKNILEGLYYDETPAGAPPQQITQCQQWGFQRIVPCIDDMTAKCTYRTTITADARYTHLITNGDVAVPRHAVGGGRDSVTYENRITPMATYLFFLGVGTYRAFPRTFEYPDGSRFALELLVPPGSDPEKATLALDILADSVLWVYLFTGPGRYRNTGEREAIYRLVKRRDGLIARGADPAEIAAVRDELAVLNDRIVPGYRYTGTVYREIGMQNSDFGGMENVGNTTITTNRIMPFPQITDASFEYMVRVKVHEYYHNLNGSEVTGRSPFEIWLNEAVTVHVENEYQAFHFGDDYCRLQTVLTLLSPTGGTFAYDRGAGSMPVEPDGFNDPNDLITGVTYVKAPEFVRMIETLIGKETFVTGLDRYHRRFAHGNASRADWIRVMEEVSGLSFERMAGQWLKQTGYPEVDVSVRYEPEEKSLTLFVRQRGEGENELWEFPFVAALVDAAGRDIAERTFRIQEKDAALVFENVARPAFLSLNRGYSFYGKVHYDAPADELFLQVGRDPDAVNRFMAWYHLLDREKMNLLFEPGRPVSEEIVDLFHSLITDEDRIRELGGEFLTIFESVDDEAHAHRYRALYDIRQKILRAIADRHGPGIEALYHRLGERTVHETDLPAIVAAMKVRQVRNVCLGILATLDEPRIHALIKDQFSGATNATDRIAAFGCYLNSSAPDRIALLDTFAAEAAVHPVAWEAFLAAVAQASSDDCVDLVRRAEAHPRFRIEQANDQRALYGRFAQNKKISLQTSAGRALFREILLKLAPVNEYSTVNALSVLGNIDRMEDEYQVPLVGVLVDLLRTLDPETTPSVYNSARRLLLGAPEASARYEAATGASIDMIR